jgi:hypothetical protein
MVETVKDASDPHLQIDGVAVDVSLLDRLRRGLDATLTQQRAHCAGIGFDVPPDSFRAVLLTEGQERDDER